MTAVHDEDEDELLKDITELTALEATRVDGVASPANGTNWLVMKALRDEPEPLVLRAGVAKTAFDVGTVTVKIDGVEHHPAVKAAEDPLAGTTNAGMVPDAIGDSGLCNAPTADGTPCLRPPMVGSTRCHHHQGVAIQKEMETMNGSRLIKRLEELYSDLPTGNAVKSFAGELLTYHKLRALSLTGDQADFAKSEASLSVEQIDVLKSTIADAEAAKSAVQDALNGGATPQVAGSLNAGGSGVAGPMTTGLVDAPQIPGVASSSVGMRAILDGGQSAYAVDESGMSAAGDVAANTASEVASTVRSLLELVRDGAGKPATFPAGSIDQQAAARVANGGIALKGLLQLADEKIKFVKRMEAELVEARSDGDIQKVRGLMYDITGARLVAEGLVTEAAQVARKAVL